MAAEVNVRREETQPAGALTPVRRPAGQERGRGPGVDDPRRALHTLGQGGPPGDPQGGGAVGQHIIAGGTRLTLEDPSDPLRTLFRSPHPQRRGLGALQAEVLRLPRVAADRAAFDHADRGRPIQRDLVQTVRPRDHRGAVKLRQPRQHVRQELGPGFMPRAW